jgi:hypothetical protein
MMGQDAYRKISASRNCVTWVTTELFLHTQVWCGTKPSPTIRRSNRHRARGAGLYQVAAAFSRGRFVRHCTNDSTCIFAVAKFTVARPQICLVLPQSYFGAAVARRTFATRSGIGSFARGVATPSMRMAMRWSSSVSTVALPSRSVRPSARSCRYSTPRLTLPVMRPLTSPSNATSNHAPCRGTFSLPLRTASSVTP